MCGIIGFTGNPNPELISIGLQSIEHRGRDEISVYSRENINFGMTRLSIVDLEKNLYPMKYRQYALIYNGEIYNYKTLKKDLQKKSIKFHTNCDAEVILPLFHLYQEKAFSMLDGMFAISIFDSKLNHLYLTRDKFGEKPLYYTIHNHQLFFSSEFKGLLSINNVNKHLNTQTLGQYLKQGFVFSPNTLIENIFTVPASSIIKFDLKSSKISKSKYWKPKINSNNSNYSLQDNILVAEDLIQKSITYRLLSDVPIGTFLSGGLDSSIISLIASKTINNLKTFSASFPNQGYINEEFFASKASELIGTNHTNIECTSENISPVARDIAKYIDHPISDPACLPTFLLSQAARKKVKVVLTGEGADEIFGGYHRYWKEIWAASIRNNSLAKPFLPLALFADKRFSRLHRIATQIKDHYNTQGIWNDYELNQLLSNPKKIPINNASYFSKIDELHPLLEMQRIDIDGYLAEQLLMKVDKMTMANNLESRAPYLSPDIVEFGLNLPTPYKIKLFHGKWILKKLAEKYFPKYFTWRPKHGFSVPLNTWLHQDLKFIINESNDLIQNYHHFLNPKYYHQLTSQHLNKTHNHADKIWNIYVLTKWLHEYQIKL